MKLLVTSLLSTLSLAVLAQAPLPQTAGEVRKIDLGAKTITLKHGPILNLGMPAMSMVFQVKAPALLDQFQVGDKVRFTAEQIGGALVATDIQAVP
ncbi:copper-binding protein [Rhodoferax sp.]|uniref:copper-binding protein n=1 Tax=Rhodoferax sp. TaxID=50421 RepID=UPI00374D6351